MLSLKKEALLDSLTLELDRIRALREKLASLYFDVAIAAELDGILGLGDIIKSELALGALVEQAEDMGLYDWSAQRPLDKQLEGSGWLSDASKNHTSVVIPLHFAEALGWRQGEDIKISETEIYENDNHTYRGLVIRKM